jgi:hypothetical protein
MDRAPQVFISHIQEDRQFAEELAEALKSRGISTRGPWEFPIDTSVEDQLERALGEAILYVVLVSDRTLSSPWVFFELGAAMGGRKRLLLIYLTERARSQQPSTLRDIPQLEAFTLRPEEVAERIANLVRAA